MKRFFLMLILFMSSFAFSQEESKVPELLKGVWKNSSRYVVFDSGYGNENGAIPMIVLRAFYGRYDDRAAEPHEYTEKNRRPVNDSTQKDLPEEMKVRFVELVPELSAGKIFLQDDGDEMSADEIPSGAWIMQVSYPCDKKIHEIPLAVIGNRLYLNFLVKDDDSDSLQKNSFLDGTIMQNGNPLDGYWKDSGNSSGILVSPPRKSKELTSFFINGNSVYRIRYWRTDMEYDGEKKAFFSDGDEIHDVPKHLFVAGNVYTCVNGMGSKIRNVEKSEGIPSEFEVNSVLVKKHETDEKGDAYSYSVRISSICGIGSPYLELVEGKTIEEIIREDSEKKYPEPKPLFPPHGILDFDWSIIEDSPSNWNMRMLDLGK